MYTRTSPYTTARPLINPPTYIEHNGLRFLIVDAPSSNNLPLYLKVNKIQQQQQQQQKDNNNLPKKKKIGIRTLERYRRCTLL